MKHDHSSRELLTGYALDAITSEERRQVELHLADCADCRAELDALRADVALLGATAATEPPPQLRARVLDAIAREQPRVDAAASEVTAPVAAPLEPAADAPVPLRRRPRRPFRFATPALAAACVALAAVTFVQTDRVADLQRDLDATSAAPAPQATALEPGVFAARSLPVATNGTLADTNAEFAYVDGGAPTLLLQHVPAPPRGQAWQAWAIDHRGHEHSLGVTASDGAMLVFPIPAELEGEVSAVAITLEPEGGSEQPTTTPLAFAELST